VLQVVDSLYIEGALDQSIQRFAVGGGDTAFQRFRHGLKPCPHDAAQRLPQPFLAAPF